jgi:hypothetical protein
MLERSATPAFGLGVALLLNLALLLGLSLYRQPSFQLAVGPEPPAMVVALERLDPARQPAKASLPPAKGLVRTTASSRSVAKPPPAAASAPIISVPSAPSSAPPAQAGQADGTAAKAAAALQKLGACASFTHDSHDHGHCGESWGYSGKSVDPLSAQARMALAPPNRDDKWATATHLRSHLADHDAASTQGSNVAYGCALRDGKWRCSTY